MKTYKVSNDHKMYSVITQLRSEGFRAWSEIYLGEQVLCTDAGIGIIGICSGNGLWAEKLFEGIPTKSCIIA